MLEIKFLFVAYFAMAVAWFVFEVFMFNKTIPSALWRGLIWPRQISKFKRGKKSLPSQKLKSD